jgi:hypothetical protein
MIIITILCILLITYIHSIKDIITLLYYSDILNEIDRSSKNCSQKSDDYVNGYNDKYRYTNIIDILIPITKKNNEDNDTFNKKKADILSIINSNLIARDFYYFLGEKSNNDIYKYYNAVSGTLLGLFVAIPFIIILYTNSYFENYPGIYWDKVQKHIWNNGMVYSGILLYIIVYVILLSILSDKLKRYNDNINTNEYTKNNIDKLKNDLEEFRKLILSHIGLILIIVLVITILYKKIYGDYYYYIAYGISIICMILIYMAYFAYNQFVI